MEQQRRTSPPALHAEVVVVLTIVRAAEFGRPPVFLDLAHRPRTPSIMKPWNRIGLGPVIGLAIEDQQISLSVVATTLGGRKEVARDVQSCEDEPQETVLERMLAPWLGQRQDPHPKTSGGASTAAGPGSRSPCPSRASSRRWCRSRERTVSSPPQADSMEAVRATNLRAEVRVIDLVKLEMNKIRLACWWPVLIVSSPV